MPASKSQESSQVPDIIEARRLAGRVLEMAESKTPIFVRVATTPSLQVDLSKNACKTTTSTSHDTSSREIQGTDQDGSPALLLLQSAVPVMICNGWLDAKDVIQYEMTSKTASLDARIWKSIFCHHHKAQRKVKFRFQELQFSEVCSIRKFFLGLVAGAMASATFLVCSLIVCGRVDDESASWEDWLRRLGIVFGAMTLAEVAALQLILRCCLGLV
jgi:hypothetical protein